MGVFVLHVARCIDPCICYHVTVPLWLLPALTRINCNGAISVYFAEPRLEKEHDDLCLRNSLQLNIKVLTGKEIKYINII